MARSPQHQYARNPQFGSMRFTDWVRLVYGAVRLLVLELPLFLIIYPYSYSHTATRSKPFADNLKNFVIRRSNELSNPAIARFFARPGQNLVDIILSSPRYRHCSKNMCQPVSRRDFAGCWFVQNSLTICMPPSSADVTIFFLHGGGYFTLQPGHYLLFVLRIAEAILDQGLTVSIFALDYALAPERQYPTQLAEAAAAYEYIVNEAKVRPEKIIIVGDSAGGHLALSLLVHLHKPNPAISSPRMTLPKPGGLVLISAWVSLYHESPSYVSNARTDIVTAKFVRRLRAQFLDGYRKSLKSPQDFDKDLCYLEFLDPHPPIDWVSVLPPWVWACAGSDEIFFDSNETWIATVQKELPEESVTFDVGSGMEHDWQFSETMIDESQKKTFLEGKVGDGKAFEGAAKIGRMIVEKIRS